MTRSSPRLTDGARRRAKDIDRHIGSRLRERRLMLGLSQQRVGELIGVTSQQLHKYEAGLNRISAGRLYQIAQTLAVEITYMFEDFGSEQWPEAKVSDLMLQHRLLLELARNFTVIKNPKQQEAVAAFVRAMASTKRDYEESE